MDSDLHTATGSRCGGRGWADERAKALRCS